MKILILFEFKNFFKKNKNLVGIVILFMITFAYTYINHDIDNSIKSSSVNLIEENIKENENSLSNIENDYDKFKDENVSASDKLKIYIGETKKEIQILREKRDGIIENNWRKVLKSDIAMDKMSLETSKRGNVVGGENPKVIEERLTINELLLKKGIEPIETRVSIKSYNLMNLILGNIVPLILMMTILLFSTDAVSSDIDGGTFKLILTQSISRNKVILSKVISYSLICILITGLLFITFFMGSSIMVGTGSPQYPINFYTGSFIDIKDFLIYSIPLLILVVLATVSISVFLSTVIGNSLSAISIAIIGYISFFIMNSQLKILSKIAHIIPFTYFDVSGLLSGGLASTYENINITYMNGIIILLITILIFNGISILNFRKKDIL